MSIVDRPFIFDSPTLGLGRLIPRGEMRDLDADNVRKPRRCDAMFRQPQQAAHGNTDIQEPPGAIE
jgi:hypothetical protein